MKRYFSFVFLFFCFLFLGNVKANTINSINMNIYVDENGDATIEEIWDYTSNKNTEIYHAYYNLGSATISDFLVSDSTGQNYQFVNWNVDASFNSKAFKYGYNYTNKGVELCLGISHYGHYTYNLKYKIKGFVAELNDAQVIYWNLLPPTSESFKSYYIKIYSDFSFPDTLDVWGFGKKGAYAYVYDGYIELSSNKQIASDEYVTVLAKFPSNTFKTTNKLKCHYCGHEEGVVKVCPEF